MAPCSTAHWISLTIHAFSISNSIPNGRQTWMLYVTIVISFEMIQDAMLFLVCQCVVGEWRSHPCCHWESKARIGRCDQESNWSKHGASAAWVAENSWVIEAGWERVCGSPATDFSLYKGISSCPLSQQAFGLVSTTQTGPLMNILVPFHHGWAHFLSESQWMA